MVILSNFYFSGGGGFGDFGDGDYDNCLKKKKKMHFE